MNDKHPDSVHYNPRPFMIFRRTNGSMFVLHRQQANGTPTKEVDDPTQPSDKDIIDALFKSPILLEAAEALTAKGFAISRRQLHDRIAANWILEMVHEVARRLHEKRMLVHCEKMIARYAVAKERRDRGPRCGAKKRDGSPCQRKPVLEGDRCPNHGGASTGPRTPEGKARVAAAQRKRWAQYRQTKLAFGV